MVLTPDEAGRHRQLTAEEQDKVNKACLDIDKRLKDAYTADPNAQSVYVEMTLPMLLEVKVRVMYEDAGWRVKGESYRDGSYLVLTPKRK